MSGLVLQHVIPGLSILTALDFGISSVKHSAIVKLPVRIESCTGQSSELVGWLLQAKLDF